MVYLLSTLRVIVLLTITVVIVPEAFSKTITTSVSKAQEENITAIIKSLSGEWSKALLEGNISVFERIWASDFIYVEPSGKRFNKVEGIADIKNSTEKLTSSVSSSIDVRVYGGGTVAVDIGDFKEVGQDKDGKAFERGARFTNVWVLNKGKWHCVSGHASTVPTQNP